ncbi:hypothetical protein C8R46DRAFT_1231125 [Mycena filopes]|nr:hypothetical protein C8R46DRAFT_1231125 [Mycena filopes]
MQYSKILALILATALSAASASPLPVGDALKRAGTVRAEEEAGTAIAAADVTPATGPTADVAPKADCFFFFPCLNI